MTERKTGSQQK